MKQQSSPTNDICGVILAAGRGTRMNSQSTNKVTMELAGKPIIARIVDFMKSLSIQNIIVVVGFAKESVYNALKGENVIYAEQNEQSGTGNALLKAFEKLPDGISNLFVVYGDDGVIYSNKNKSVINKLISAHNKTGPAITFLTIEQENPAGLGRIVRDEKGNIKAIVEEKDASEEERKIKEINPGCFVFSSEFLRKYLPKLSKNKITGEYYLTELIEIAIKNSLKIETVQGGRMLWRGVNTKEELDKAEELMLRFN